MKQDQPVNTFLEHSQWQHLDQQVWVWPPWWIMRNKKVLSSQIITNSAHSVSASPLFCSLPLCSSGCPWNPQPNWAASEGDMAVVEILHQDLGIQCLGHSTTRFPRHVSILCQQYGSAITMAPYSVPLHSPFCRGSWVFLNWICIRSHDTLRLSAAWIPLFQHSDMQLKPCNIQTCSSSAMELSTIKIKVITRAALFQADSVRLRTDTQRIGSMHIIPMPVQRATKLLSLIA